MNEPRELSPRCLKLPAVVHRDDATEMATDYNDKNQYTCRIPENHGQNRQDTLVKDEDLKYNEGNHGERPVKSGVKHIVLALAEEWKRFREDGTRHV